ncbi:MAG TPA: M48 family metalloprotease [Myxococcota bacterium]|nr:M48 family metalloprotease [Myxococcota bacterium]
MRRRWASVALAVLAAVLAPPARADRTVLLDSTYDDRDAGREGAKGVEAQIGLLNDKALDAYVQGIGDKLLRAIPNRPFEYQFRVVDQVAPNAFALPGGHIFVSRGLLALANDEDQLACVVGHEIGHVVKRHSAAQQESESGRFPLLSPVLRQGEMAAYSRDLERSADHDGQILCAAAGYDPRALADFLEAMMNWEKLETGSVREASFFDTHPASSERATVARVEASELRWTRDPKLGDPRAALLAHIDGLPLGQRPEAGMFLGDVFLHPSLGFKLRFPHGWAKANTPQAVGAQSPHGDAMVYLASDVPPGEPRQVAETWADKNVRDKGGEVENAAPFAVGGLPAWRLDVAGSTGGMSVRSIITFIPFADSVWRLTGAAVQSKDLDTTLATTRSFRAVTDEDRANLRVTRLAVEHAQAGEDFTALTARTQNVWGSYQTAVFNGLLPDTRFQGGESVKIARESPYSAPPASPPN